MELEDAADVKPVDPFFTCIEAKKFQTLLRHLAKHNFSPKSEYFKFKGLWDLQHFTN